MSLPSKISPDRIKDAVVEFSVSYSNPYEVIFGKILDYVNNQDVYNYVNPNRNIPIEIQELSGRIFLFYNEKIKFQISSKTISINCYSNYISWALYLPEIMGVIELINKVSANSIIINRIGLRYVSEYENVDLSECLNFSFSYGYPQIKSKHYSFNSEFEYKNAIIILALRNMKPTKTENKTVYVSHIDIDVIQDDLNISFKDDKELLNCINEIHSYEKELFFSLLKDEFLKKLNPQY